MRTLGDSSARGPVQRRVGIGDATLQGDHHRTGTEHSLVVGTCIRALALAVAMTTCQAGVHAQDTMSGAPFVAGSSVHVSDASTDVRTDTASALSRGADAPISVTGSSGGALVINPTFDSSITGDVNSAQIQAVINGAVNIFESLFNDPITVSIYFRYATTAPDGSPLPGTTLAQTNSVLYIVPWSTFISALTADATTVNDTTANASLPGSALSTNVLPSSANGRSVGLSTPPAMFANGSIGVGGPYDAIITLNSAQPFQFTRPPSVGLYDALRATEHEIDEALGLGSAIGSFSDLRPQDLYSWSAAGVRNVTTSGSRYFSIDGGTTNLVGFNQTAGGDFGDWLSGSCPQVTPYVQNAFSCSDQASDVTQTSPEGVNLDVIGYDLLTGPTPTPTVTPTSGPATPTATQTPLFALCGATPIGGCDGPGKGALLLDNGKHKLLWKWLKGPMVVQSDFGNPTTGTSYTLCVYDDDSLKTAMFLPTVNWQPVGAKGYQYKDVSGAFLGLTKVLLKGGGAGQSKILVKGKGLGVPSESLPFSQSINVTVQLLRNDAAQCWEAAFLPPATSSSSTQFKDKF